jgi:hypothetical protein
MAFRLLARSVGLLLHGQEGAPRVERDVLSAGAGHLEPGRQFRSGGLRAGSVDDPHQPSGEPRSDGGPSVIRRGAAHGMQREMR